MPEWGGDVNVYPLSASDTAALKRWRQQNPHDDSFNLQLLKYALRDLHLDEVQLQALAAKNGAVIERLANKAAALCNPDYEELEGNSDAGQSAGSG